MLWHGRDLRQYKRLLSPPLEVLLTCPGVGGLGRGLASLPVASLAEAGLASGLSTLAEDAVAVSTWHCALSADALPAADQWLLVMHPVQRAVPALQHPHVVFLFAVCCHVPRTRLLPSLPS